MKTYIKPEIIAAEMESLHMVAATGPSNGDNVGNRYVGGTGVTSYTKENNGWDDWNE